ncbi:MAG: NAD(P)H nitroreductase [Alphaproteobacteria bacterium BRH_c36]|nr:MAG: NAD(P)H nitroreductase [Alphaproteobacteria bacterium BRH_c36]
MSNTEILDFLSARRSLKPTMFADQGPSPDELTRILTIAARVPDHKKLNPWRFIVFSGESRAKAGELFAKACTAEDRQEPSEIRLQTERERFLRAPLVVAVIASPVEKPGAPEWEQILSAGAAAFNLCLAANALGYGTCWITEWIAYSPIVKEGLALSETERVAGFVYIGKAKERQDDRDRPNLPEIVTHWQG